MSTLRCNAIQNTSGVEQYLAKAWVNFNGTGTVAIRASGNVSSITDNGVGDYTVNFTNAMPDANYSVVGMGQRFATTDTFQAVPSMPASQSTQFTNTGSVRIYCLDTANGKNDAFTVTIAVFR